MAQSKKAEIRSQHWAKTRNTTIWILIVWAIFSFVVHWYAKPLNESSILGFPMGYWFAVQGSPLAFVIILFTHNWLQDKIDDEAGLIE